MGENDFKVEIGISYDKEKITELQNDIKALSSKENKIKIKTNYDFTKLNKDLDDLQTKLKSMSNFKINITSNYTDGNINNSSGKKKEIKFAEISDIQKVRDRASSLNSTISDTNNILQNMKGISSASKNLNKFNTKLSNTSEKLELVQKTLQSNNIESSALNKIITQLDKIEVKAKSTQSNIDSLKENTIKEIEDSLDTGYLESKLTNLENQTKNLYASNEKDRASKNINSAKTILGDLTSARENKDKKAMLSYYSQFETQIENITSSLKVASKEQKIFSNAANLETRRLSLLDKVSQLMNSGSAAAKNYNAVLSAMFKTLSQGGNIDISALENQWKRINSEIKATGISTTTFMTRLKTQFQKLSTYLTATTVINKTSQALRTMYNNVVEIDTAMTSLYRVTNLTTSQYESLYSNMTKTAKEYGSTLVSIIDSTSEWAKLGFDANTANDLAGVTTMYQNITDVDTATAVNDLVTAYKGFQTQLNGLYSGDSAKAVEYVADIYNLLGNKYAVSAQDVGSALSRASSSLALAGNTIQESAAMSTAITEVTQDADRAGKCMPEHVVIRGTTNVVWNYGKSVKS